MLPSALIKSFSDELQLIKQAVSKDWVRRQSAKAVKGLRKKRPGEMRSSLAWQKARGSASPKRQAMAQGIAEGVRG
jgi:hypothetical protein